MSNKIRLEKRCLQYIKDNIRAPSLSIIKRWGQKLKVPANEINDVSQQLKIRHQLGKYVEQFFW